MYIEETKKASISIVTLKGRLDGLASPTLQDHLLGIVEKGERHVIIDFGEVDYISSAGMRVILLVAKKLKSRQGDIHLCNMQAFVRDVLDIAGFTTVLKIYPTTADAIVSLG